MPTKSDVDTALRLVEGDPIKEAYFFERLNTADWIDPLLEAGRLQAPPDLESDAGSEARSWPDSRYLARIANQAPDAVAEVILTHLSATRNPMVKADCVLAFTRMPARSAAGSAAMVARWIREGPSFGISDLAVDLITLLAEVESESALTIFVSLFEIEPPAREHPQGGPDSGVTTKPKAVADLGASEYAHLFERAALPLSKSVPARLYSLTSDWLSNSILWEPHDSETGWDASEIWRSQLEGDTSARREPIHVLIDWLRSGALSTVTVEPDRADEVISSLVARHWTIFRRVALDVARSVAERRPALAGRVLNDAMGRDNPSEIREFSLLARASYEHLSEEHRATYLAWAMEGPPDQEMDQTQLETNRLPLSSAELDRRKQQAILRRLTPVSEQLPAEENERYRQLVDAFGPIEAGQPPFVIRTWSGEQSPLTPEHLSEKSIAELAEYLETWQPPIDHGQWPRAESIEGLRTALQQSVRRDPARYSRGGLGLLGVQWFYLASVVSALREAVKEEETIDWAGALSISESLLDQVVIEDEDTQRFYPDEARRFVASFIDQGLHPGPSSIPHELADRLVPLLIRLLDDPDPSTTSEGQKVDYAYSPFMISLNTVRGQATHATCRYLVWRKGGRREAGDAMDSAGINGIPALAAALDRRLDSETEPSLGVRAALGAWFGALFAVDRKWTEERLERFFPSQPEATSNAAFHSHLQFGPPISKPVFDVLREIYGQSIARLEYAPASEDDLSLDNPAVRLGEHLVVMYWLGSLELGPADSLLAKYFEIAMPDVRRNVIEFVGRSLAHTTDTIPDSTLNRIRDLWEWRVKSLGDEPKRGPEIELAGYVPWLRCESFSVDWRLRQLELVSRLASGSLNRSIGETLEWLAKHATASPAIAVQIVQRILESEHKTWELFDAREAILVIVRSAFTSQETIAGNRARRISRTMFDRGYQEFRQAAEKGES